jgi:hypothetical protein
MFGRPRRIKQKNVPSLQGAKGFVPHIRPRKPRFAEKLVGVAGFEPATPLVPNEVRYHVRPKGLRLIVFGQPPILSRKFQLVAP